jgi:hypothetical protein
LVEPLWGNKLMSEMPRGKGTTHRFYRSRLKSEMKPAVRDCPFIEVKPM